MLFYLQKPFGVTAVTTSATHRNRPPGTGAAAPTRPIDDTRIREITELAPPAHLLREFPASELAAATTFDARTAIHRVLHGADDRLLVVVGPCSIHDYDAAIDYATRLAALRQELADRLIIVMRVYFEKPRTTVGWKGLINDPRLDDSFRINEGLRLARHILLEINDLALPAATEYLDMITPQYIADLIAWGAIGARTTESQVHRQLASGLSCPVGFKNGTDGDVRIAVDAIKAASAPHHFLSVTKGGHSAIVHTGGNEDCHIVLRGGKDPNFDAASIEATCRELAQAGLAPRVMVDCSHANSRKRFERQIEVARDVGAQVAAGDARIIGVMIESHINEGRQDLVPGQALQYGVSITDACIGWDATQAVLRGLADAVSKRRVVQSEAA
jgi:3-deoxy-7-phosphoheptulonate synthase